MKYTNGRANGEKLPNGGELTDYAVFGDRARSASQETRANGIVKKTGKEQQIADPREGDGSAVRGRFLLGQRKRMGGAHSRRMRNGG